MLLRNVLTTECLRGMSNESKVREWSRACVQSENKERLIDSFHRSQVFSTKLNFDFKKIE
mgnify:FL=1